MVYGLKLLLPVLVLWAIAMFVLRACLSDLFKPKDFKIAFGIVLLFTVVEFLSVRPLIFLAFEAVAVYFAQSWLGGDLKAKVATFWMAAIIFIPLQSAVAGFGGIAYILMLDHFRVASLVLLAPAALGLLFAKNQHRRTPRLLDFLVLGYPIFRLLMLAPSVAMTATLRSFIELGLDLVLPYFVMTRGLRELDEFRFVLHRLLVGCLFAATIAFLEAALRKNIYSDLQWVYGVTWSLTHTLMRGGLNRVQAMTPQPILYATQILFTMGLWAALAPTARRWVRPFVMLALAGALLLTWSRGPWLGALLFAATLFALGKFRPGVVASLLGLTLIAGVAAKVAGLDEATMTALKGVFGSSQDEAGSIQYRSQLLDTAIALIKQSPWLGVPSYASFMQDLKQGEGIIDIVNTYVSVALDTGLIGLALFLAPFLYVLRCIFKDLGNLDSAADRDRVRFMRAFAAVIVGCLLTIFTTSIFERLPFLMQFLVVAPSIWLSFSPVQTTRSTNPEVDEGPFSRGHPRGPQRRDVILQS